MQQTQVQLKCIAKTEKLNWDPNYPRAFAIELEVPYDQSSIYWKLSGGTNLVLNTVNKEAAAMFEIGKAYYLDLYPVPEPETQEALPADEWQPDQG